MNLSTLLSRDFLLPVQELSRDFHQCLRQTDFSIIFCMVTHETALNYASEANVTEMHAINMTETRNNIKISVKNCLVV